MQVTIELLRACWPCTDAYKWSINIFKEAGKDVLTFEEGLEYLIRDNAPDDWIDWYKSLRSNPTAVKFHNDYRYIEKYKVYDFVNYHEEYDNLSDALIASEEYKQSLELHNPGLFTCQKVTVDENNNETMIRINLDQAEPGDSIRVFDPISALFSETMPLEEAKVELARIKEKYFNNIPGSGILQGIQNADGDIAWVEYSGNSQ